MPGLHYKPKSPFPSMENDYCDWLFVRRIQRRKDTMLAYAHAQHVRLGENVIYGRILYAIQKVRYFFDECHSPCGRNYDPYSKYLYWDMVAEYWQRIYEDLTED